MKRKIQWGILGPGKIAHSFAEDFQFVKSGDLVAVASRSPDRANAFADRFAIARRYGAYDELYADPDIDAVYIATPHSFHFEQVKACLQAGKAVLCEKPITIDPAQCDELIKIQQATGQYLMEGMWTYFLPTLKKARQWVEQGKIGNLLHLNASFGFAPPFDAKSRLFNPALAGGAVFDIGIYPIAMACHFLGSEPNRIQTLRHNAPTGVDDDMMMILDYGEQVANLHASFRCKLDNTAHLIGDKGRIEIPSFWKSTECRLYTSGDQIEYFKDPRLSHGYDFETEAMCQDMLAGKIMSDVVPLATSAHLQQLMAKILHNT